MKKITLLLFLLFFTLKIFAQTNFYKFSVGGGVGTTLAFADVQNKIFAFAGYGVIDYQLTPYLTIGLELQKGEIAGGDITYDPNNRQFINSYLAGSANFKFQLGEVLTAHQLNNNFLYNIRGLYAGLGFGYIKNKISNVRYYGDNFYPGADNSKEGIVPLNLGINFYLPDNWNYTRYVLNVNFQTTMAIGEGLDGYGHSSPERNDIYTYFSVGVKYNFGPMGLDRRR